ncbi:MAG: type sorting protein, partial [Bacteroidota bacterium]|nr:type sorting protein [Bacteroidota bacterium]
MNKNFKKNLSIIIIFIIGVINLAAVESLKILPANQKTGRLCEALANTVRVRLKPGYYDAALAANIISPLSAKISERLMEPVKSMTFNIKKRLETTLYSHQKIDEIIKAEEPLLRTYIITYSGDEPPEKFCTRLKELSSEVDIAEPYYIDSPLYSPNDPLASQQTDLTLIRAFEAWDIFKGDPSIIVGISDIGAFQEHEDLAGSIAVNSGEIQNNGIDDDGNGYIDDYNGYNLGNEVDHTGWGNTFHSYEHGTNVAGICGAAFDNSKGIAGAAGKCRIFPIKIGITGSNDQLPFSYNSIKYAADRGFKVLNCSWGKLKPYSEIDQSIIDYAVSRDVAIVAAGGNEKNSIGTVYPAGYRGILGVGEVDQQDVVTGNSSFGEQVRIMAPGYANYATTNDNSYTNSGSRITGTSFASPVVAGVVALVRARHPEMTALQA